MEKICLSCNKKFDAIRKERKYCSNRCKYIESGKRMKILGLKPPNPLGRKHSEKTKNKMRGRKMPIESRIKLSNDRRGERGSNWRGGLTPINESIRRNIEYRLWREAVFARDNWTCQDCGKRGGKLNADHIKPFAHYPELRFAIDNGRTLCILCHRKTNTYGGRSKGLINWDINIIPKLKC